MVSFFQAGGIGMYPTLAFGLLLLAVGVAYALRPERRLLTPFVALGLVSFACGALGATMGFVTTLLYVGRLPAGEQYGTTLVGFAESLHNLALALVVLVISTLALAIGALRAARAAGPEPR